MLELLTIVLCYGLDFLTKQLAASQLIYAVGGVPLIGDSVLLYYAENHGDNTSVIRGNNAVGLVLRLLLLAAALYLILAQRKKLRPITRFALGMLVAGVTGYFAIRVMLRAIKRRGLWGFAVYTGLLGAAILVDQFFTHRFF